MPISRQEKVNKEENNKKNTKPLSANTPMLSRSCLLSFKLLDFSSENRKTRKIDSHRSPLSVIPKTILWKTPAIYRIQWGSLPSARKCISSENKSISSPLDCPYYRRQKYSIIRNWVDLSAGKSDEWPVITKQEAISIIKSSQITSIHYFD